MLEVGKICNTIELNNPDNCTIHCLQCWQLLKYNNHSNSHNNKKDKKQDMIYNGNRGSESS